MSIVVVQDGKVLISKGYGVRELGKNDAVDRQTLFGCMSTTKAMTAVAIAMLVDEGKVSWNDKVIKHLPNFRLADPYVTNELKIRDLFTHNERLDELAKAIKDVEHEADHITHEVSTRLAKTFITPLDREDINNLVQELDNVVDLIDGTARRAQMFHLAETREPAKKLCELV